MTSALPTRPTDARRTIELALNAFPVIPSTLADGTGSIASTVSFEVKTLFHHYFLSKFADGSEDTGVYEYERMITSGADWRFKGTGIGRDKEAKRNASNELGKAFARWFCSEHLGFTYFTPFEDVLDKPNSDGSCWRRVEEGDLPDLICGPSKTDVNLLEAKGRYKSISFKTKEFEEFRSQLRRAKLIDSRGAPLSVKGYLSVARWTTEETPRTMARLLVEDPRTEGRDVGQGGFPSPIGLAMVVGHYAPVLERLQLPAHAESLRTRQLLTRPVGTRRVKWRCIAGPLKGMQFVGGLIPRRDSGWFPSALFLNPPFLFFGLEAALFEQVERLARQGLDAGADIATALEPVHVPQEMGSLSLLRDGTVVGPDHYFEPGDVVEL